ncbi:MAG: hypothetical protein IK003_06365 [Prevotella sp.]|nr:hypothetical protein [Prevotella sp.]
MKRKLSKLFILSICLLMQSLLSCNSRKEKINKQLNELYSSVINIPYSDLDTLVVDTAFLTSKAKYQYLAYVDSSQCTPCYAGHHQEWETILARARKLESSITLTIIIESDSLSEEVKYGFKAADFCRSIFIDRKGVFRKKNPSIPESNIMHVMLLDQDNHVVLVGDPVRNDNIEQLLHNMLEKNKK